MRFNSWIIGLWVSAAISSCGLAGEALRFDFSPSPLAEFSRGLEKERKSLQVPRCAAAPAIDGRLDDPAWRAALVLNVALGDAAAPDTVIRLCYDDAAIYLGIECKGPPRAVPVPADTGRDSGDLWKAEHVEMWFAPVDEASSCHFGVGVSGLIYDGLCAGESDDSTWNPEWSHAVTRTANGWVAELAIPKEALRLPRWPAQLGFDIGRDGPGRAARSWVGRYGDTSKGRLVLQGVAEPVRAPAESWASAAGAALEVSLERSCARPGERWIEAGLRIQPSGTPLPRLRISAELFAPGSDKPSAELSAAPTQTLGKLFADLRSLNLKSARVRVELHDGDKLLAVSENLCSTREPAAALTDGTRIPITIDPPPGVKVENYPVTFGVPFAAGVLWDVEKLRVVDSQGKGVPCQKEVTARWAQDGAIRWVRFDALAGSPGAYFVEMGASAAGARPGTPVTVVEQNGRITLNTGAARYILGKGASPVEEIWLGDALVARSAGTQGLYVVDHKGRVGSASAEGEKMEIESAGPVAASVRFEGFYKTPAGENLARHITYVEAFAGQPFARITHTLILVNDTNQVWFKDIGWEFAVTPGENPRAFFGAARDDARKVQSVPVAAGAAAYMFQDQHYRFGAGKNHFLVAQTSAGAPEAKVCEGEECGDYALLLGGTGGMMMACKEAARQHPKEFEVRPDRIVMRLFSNRAGEELDFRMAALVKKWNLAAWVDKAMGPTEKAREVKPNTLDDIGKYASNACGWAKTHDLLIAPVTAAEPAADMAWSNSHAVYANADPVWICRSEAIGRIHPKDPQRFPLEEGLIDGTFNVWEKRATGGWGNFGFVDYAAGPTLEYSYVGDVPRLYRYMKWTYSLRTDLWMQYARSGERRVRELAEATNRAYLDNAFSHWDSKDRTAGLFVVFPNTEWPGKGALPLYWEGSAATQVSCSSNMNQFTWFYYLTGSRRARDGVLGYANGIKRYWTPQVARSDWRQLMLMRMIMQCYEFTWDPKLLALAEATTDTFYDPDGAILLSKNRPYKSSTYKTQVDVAALLDAWRITGYARYHAMARRVAEYWWDEYLGGWPISYCSQLGRIGQFLYDETGDASIPEALLIEMRQAATAFDPATGKVIGHLDGRVQAEDASFVFNGIPFAEQVVTRSGIAKKPLCSWIGWDDFGGSTCLYVQKGDPDSLIVDMKTTGGTGSAGAAEVSNLGQRGQGEENLFSVDQRGGGVATVRVTKDAPAGCYRIAPGAFGTHFALAHSAAPMVLYAPGYWQPRPHLAPSPRWYFSVPQGAGNPQIYFDGTARLYDPAGKALSESQAAGGWVNLPADKSGLWSFEPVSVKGVRVRNLPPFFAADSPQSYFDPPVDWPHDQAPAAIQAVPPGATFIAGADPADKAMYLDSNRTFHLDGGPARPDGDGTRFLPFKQGTIEFFMKPSWDVADLPGTAALLRLTTDKEPWTMAYLKNSRAESWLASHCLQASFMTDGRKGRMSMSALRRTVFDPDEWVHVAWTWGTTQYMGSSASAKGPGVTTHLYVNGRTAQEYIYPGAGNFPCEMPKALLLLNLFSGKGTAYDELRISDVVRYKEDFSPPSPGTPFKLDEHTRALFHFNGDLKGESFGYQGELAGKFAAH